ncbi:MAG: hypothetical protein Q9220_001142 [cf. Caloplaca sp. 1 TL-2023]
MCLSFFLSSLLSIHLYSSVAAGAVYQGFNYGTGIDYLTAFTTARNLLNTTSASARLYTMIEANTPNSPTSAIPAAIATNTTLLLGLYCSAGQRAFDNETIALTAAITAYGQPFIDLIAGISVGSEDLYRASPIGIQNGSPAGDTVANLLTYINQTRAVLKNTANGIAKDKPVGHVDTWQMWTSSSSSSITDHDNDISSLIASIDFLGVDAYPYYQRNDTNTPANGQPLFEQAYQSALAAATKQGKEVWITETGWPVNGTTIGMAVPSRLNAERYWWEVGCGMLFGRVNTWWYTLSEGLSLAAGKPDFGVVDGEGNETARFYLGCEGGTTRVFGGVTVTQAMGAATGGAVSSSSTAVIADPCTTIVPSGDGRGSVSSTTTQSSGGGDSTTSITSTVFVTPLPASASASPPRPTLHTMR